MTHDELIAQDQQAITDAEVALDAAKAKLLADTAARDAVAPHLSVLDRIIAEFDAEVAVMDAPLVAGYSAVKAKLAPMIDELRALLQAA